MQAPAELLAGKYQFTSGLPGGTQSFAWLAQDVDTKKSVVVAALAGARTAALKKSVGVHHPHLAAVLEIIEDPPLAQVPGGKTVAALVVAESYRGESLHQRLKRGPLEPALAVDWFVRIASAARAIHEAGGAHGAISPRSIIVSPEGDAPGPILTQLTAPSSGAYCAPERLQGLGPGEADDIWALHAALFTSLTCTPPFRGENKNDLLLSIAGGRMQKLEALGVSDVLLTETVERGLTADLKRRCSKAENFINALDAWSPNADDWEDDAATIVASNRDFARLAAAVGTGKKPEPVASVPPVALDEGEPRPPSEAPVPTPATPAAAPVDSPPKPAAAPQPVAPPPPRPAAAPRAGATPPTPAAHPPVAAAPTPPAAEELSPFEPPNFSDDDDETAIMEKPPSDIASLLRKPPPPREPAPFAAEAMEAETLPESAPPSVPVISSAPENPFAMASAPTSPANLEPTPPPLMASAPTPAPPVPPAPAQAFPPTISAYPPATSVAPSVAPPALKLDDDEIKMRNPGRTALIVMLVILALLAIGIAIALYLNHSASRAGTLRAETSTGPARASHPPLPKTAASALTRTAAVATASAAPAPALERGTCVASFFEAGTLSGNEDFDFLCRNDDFRGINSQLHRRLVVAGAGKVTPGMREWSTLAWFELTATAVVRTACCPPGARSLDLPQTAAGCDQLKDVLPEVAKLPVRTGEVEARATRFEQAVVCLFAKGIPRPYKYSARPTGHARLQFQGFLSRAAARS